MFSIDKVFTVFLKLDGMKNVIGEQTFHNHDPGKPAHLNGHFKINIPNKHICF